MDSLADLINSAQAILDSGFDVQAFLSWKGLAFVCLVQLLGPFHYYTQNFRRIAGEQSARGLLAGEGILLAAQEHILMQPHRSDANPGSGQRPV